MKKWKYGIIIGALFLVVVIICGLNEYSNTKVRLITYDYTDAAVPKGFDGFKIMVISDLHNAPFSQQISKYIIDEKPDIAIFTGDMVQLPDSDLTEAIQIVQKTKDVTAFYAVTGNHEIQNTDLWRILEKLENAGVCMIDSRDETIARNGDRINLAGFADPGMDVIRDKDIPKIRQTIGKILADEEKPFTILALHRSYLYPYIKDLGANLILAGHLHGGIVRLPVVGGLIGPKKHGLFPEYEYGYYKEEEDSAMIVSAGCDKNPKKKRIFNPPEVVMVTLKAE